MSRTGASRPTQAIPLSRRDFMSLAGGGAAAAALGFNPFRTMAQTPEIPIPATFQEAPILTEQVNAGTLPPVAERLPAEPLVVEPYEAVGKYGGTWRSAMVGGGDFWFVRVIGYQYLVRWDPNWEAVVPNLAKSWEVENDGLSYVFTLRDGIKWSDGQPFGVDDIEFYSEAWYRDPDLNTSLGTNPWTFEKLDEHSFRVTFERPEGLFIQTLATPSGEQWTRYPKHYLSQFHAKYNTTNLDQLVAEAGVADWTELFRTKGAGIQGTSYNALWQNHELPTLYPWVLAQSFTGSEAQMRFNRNPYFWKVDTAGNQLPYIDSITFDVLQDNEVLVLKILNGEIDIHQRHVNNNANKSVFADGAEQGGYRLYDTLPANMNMSMISLNLTHKNPAYRELFNNKDFRIALSHAINRQEIIDTIYVSQGEPWQGSPRPESVFKNDTLAKQYTEYDVDLANSMLDAILPNKGGDGYRTLPDGSPLVISIEVATGSVSSPVDDMNLVSQHWQAVGINAQVKPEDRSLLYERKEANDHDCNVWQGDGGLQDALLEMRWYAPVAAESNYAIPWYIWFSKPSNPTTAEEAPPEAVQQQLQLVTELRSTADEAKQAELFQQILQVAIEQFYAIGVNLPGPGYGIAKTNVKNIPNPVPDAYLYPSPAPVNTETFFFDV
jgi:peptide/nickel transport system substrate-binding protein